MFDAAADGNQIGPSQERLAWPISNGLFQVDLDFGANAFDGSSRFLEVRVNGTPLIPRQPVTATPQALIATTTVAGAIGTSQINPAAVQRRVTGNCPAGQYIQSVNQDGTVACGSEPPGWRLGGNAGTSSTTDFLGTTDNQALELRTANVRSLRIEPSAELFEGLPITANVIAGSHANEVTPGVRGATIAGGGVPAGNSDPDHPSEAPNRVTDNYGTIGGGYANQAGNGGGTTSDSAFATVGGGRQNTASDQYSTVGGGWINAASGTSSTVGGGDRNTASGNHSTVGGGKENTANGINSTVGGGLGNFASDAFGTVGGGNANFADGFWSTIGGGWINAASGTSSTVGGGDRNIASGNHSTVGGGDRNIASGLESTASGGLLNCAGGSYSWAGGRRAKVRPATSPGGSGACSGLTYPGDFGDQGTFVWADSQDVNFVSSGPNQFLVRAAGGVGINTNNPGVFTLAVNGSAAKTDGGSWSVFSDARLKSNIRALGPGVLDRVLSLSGYTFEYNEQALEHRLGLPGEQIGLLAQEVAEVFPEWVDADAEGFLYVTERGTTAILIEAMRELRNGNDHDLTTLRSENVELRAEVAVLKVQSGQMRELADRNADLEARLATLEALLIDDRQVAERLQ